MLSRLLHRRFHIDTPESPDALGARLRALPRQSDSGFVGYLDFTFTWNGLDEPRWRGRVRESRFELLRPASGKWYAAQGPPLLLRGEWGPRATGTRLTASVARPRWSVAMLVLPVLLFGAVAAAFATLESPELRLAIAVTPLLFFVGVDLLTFPSEAARAEKALRQALAPSASSTRSSGASARDVARSA